MLFGQITGLSLKSKIVYSDYLTCNYTGISTSVSHIKIILKTKSTGCYIIISTFSGISAYSILWVN